MTSDENNRQPEESAQSGSWPRSAKLTVGVVSLIAVIAIVAAAVGGGGDELGVISQGDTTADVVDETVAETGDDQTLVSESEGESDAASEEHQFGEAVELSGFDTTVEVTPEKYFKSLKPDPYGFVEPDQALVGFTIEFKNLGSVLYDGFASNDVVLIDKSFGAWESDLEEPASGSACVPPLFEVKLPPDANRRGCLTFTLPKNVKPSQLQVQLDSRNGPDIGVWEIPSG